MECSSWPERKSPRLQGFNYSESQCYFVTVCTDNRKPLFVNSSLNNALVEQLIDHARAHAVVLYAWCLMPDHCHLLVEMPEGGLSLSAWVGGFKSRSTLLAWSLGFHGPLWQGRFYDQILRRAEELEQVALYIVHNPVRKGLAEPWDEYPWSGMEGRHQM
jgi:putative transposase